MSVSRVLALRYAGMGLAAALCPRAAIAQSDLFSLKIGVPNADDGVTPLLYGISSGLFKRAGFGVDLTFASSGAAVSAALAGGAVDIGISSLVPLISAHTHALPFQLIAPAAVYTSDPPYGALIVRNDGPIHTARDLDGRPVAASALRDMIDTSTLAWIDLNGGHSSTVKTVEFPQTALVAAIIAGRIDAGTLLQPRLSEALDSGSVRILGKPFDVFGKRFPLTAWFAMADVVSKNQELVVRFARAIRQSNNYCNTHHAETAQVLAASSKVDLAIIQRSSRLQFGDVLDLREIQNFIDVCTRYKVIDASFPARDIVSPAVQFLVR